MNVCDMGHDHDSEDFVYYVLSSRGVLGPFETEEEANEAAEKIQGAKVLAGRRELSEGAE